MVGFASASVMSSSGVVGKLSKPSKVYLEQLHQRTVPEHIEVVIIPEDWISQGAISQLLDRSGHEGERTASVHRGDCQWDVSEWLY